jgi:hypothetical protein
MFESSIENFNFDERYHLNNKFIIIYFEIMLNHKSTVVLSKLSFHQILFWFNAFHSNMSDLINALKYKC